MLLRTQLPYNLGASPNLHDVGSQNQPADGEEEKFRSAEFGKTLRQKYGLPEEEVMVARTREVMTIPVPIDASLWTQGGVSSRATLVVGRVNEGQRSAEASEVSGRCRDALTAGRKLTCAHTRERLSQLGALWCRMTTSGGFQPPPTLTTFSPVVGVEGQQRMVNPPVRQDLPVMTRKAVDKYTQTYLA